MHVDVRIQRFKDADKPAFPELANRKMKEIEVVGCAILECGTVSGGPSLMFHGLDEDRVVVFQLSGTMLHAIASTLRGAQQQWMDNPQ